jgi:hypothetical protein
MSTAVGTGTLDQAIRQESSGVIEQLNTQRPSKEKYHLVVFVWGHDDMTTRSILGLRKGTPLSILKPSWYHDKHETYWCTSVPESMPGAEYYASSCGAVKSVAYRVWANLIAAFPQDGDRRDMSKLQRVFESMREMDGRHFHKFEWETDDRGVLMLITRLRLPDNVDLVEPSLAHLEASEWGERLKAEMDNWRRSFDKALFSRLWIPAAVCYATQAPWVLSPEDKAFADSIGWPSELPDQFKASWLEGHRLQSGLEFTAWLVRAGYAVRDKRGVLRPRCRVAKAKQASLGPDPTALGNEQIPFKVAEEMARALADTGTAVVRSRRTGLGHLVTGVATKCCQAANSRRGDSRRLH